MGAVDAAGVKGWKLRAARLELHRCSTGPKLAGRATPAFHLLPKDSHFLESPLGEKVDEAFNARPTQSERLNNYG